MKDYPIHVRDIIISDPFILADPVSKKYYTYAGFFKENCMAPGADPVKPGCFYALESPDLVNWSYAHLVFEAAPDFWGPKDYWAPECHYYKGKYYIFSSFRGEGTYRRCQALVSESPLGPFAPIHNYPVTPEGWQCLDASLYVDRNEKPWMIFCHEWTQVQDGQVCAIPLSDDLGDAIGPPMILFRSSDAVWREDRLGYYPEEGMTWISGYITDGCFAYRSKDGTLFMLWSNYCRHGYAVAYAKSLSGEIWGPWEQEPIPLYVMDGGHAMLFHRFDGQLMMSMHAPNHPHDKKRMLLFEMDDRDGKLRTMNECTGNWFSIDKAKEPAGYYTYTPTSPVAFTEYAKERGAVGYIGSVEEPKKKEEKE